MRIPDDEEFTRDWDWFAVDPLGQIGHFTTAGFRRLPTAVKDDFEGAEACIRYFEGEAQTRSGYFVREDLERLVGSFDGPDQRERYLRSFVNMAQKGLFSFDTKPLTNELGQYLLVARPKIPLNFDELPAQIADLLRRVKSSVPFHISLTIEESVTYGW
jgi:hypothetical protein